MKRLLFTLDIYFLFIIMNYRIVPKKVNQKQLNSTVMSALHASLQLLDCILLTKLLIISLIPLRRDRKLMLRNISSCNSFNTRIKQFFLPLKVLFYFHWSYTLLPKSIFFYSVQKIPFRISLLWPIRGFGTKSPKTKSPRTKSPLDKIP